MKTPPFLDGGKVGIELRFISRSEENWILDYSIADVAASKGENCGLERDCATVNNFWTASTSMAGPATIILAGLGG